MKIKYISFLIVLSFLSCKNNEKENKPNLDSQSNVSASEIISSDSADTIKTDSLTNDSAENTKLLLDFYKKNAQKPQLFLVNNNKDTTIVCAQKTRIKINARSFVSSKTGKEIVGKVQISVNEYYKISDILLANLSTTANGKLLETGGMINITVSSNQEKCELKKGNTIEIGFPRKEEKEGMQLFTGNWNDNNINWQVQKNSTDLNQIFTKVDQLPEYPGGVDKMHEFIGRNVNIPDENKSGKIYCNFIIDKEGNVTNVRITRGLGKEIDDEVIRVIKTLKKFIPGKINGIAVNFSYTIPITVDAPEEYDLATSSRQRKISKKQFEQKYSDDDKLQNSGTENISYYLFSGSRLGYINCDRFWNITSTKIDYVMNFDNNSQTNAKIVFHRFKSIMNEFSDNSKISFNNIPSGEKITIIAIKYFDKKPYLAIKETETSTQVENNLTFQPITIDLLKRELRKLDRFN